MLAVDLKALALFSLLFGAGLAIQFERLAKSERRTVLLVRRLVVLLAFGLIHLCLIWNGDILTEYALAGFIVLPFLFGPRWLLAVAALASLGLYLAMQAFPPPGLWPGTAAMGQDVVEAHRIYATGGFLDVLAFRLREIPLFAALHVYIFPRTIGLFLLGAFAWRTGILRNPPRHLLFSIAAACIGFGAALILAHAGRPYHGRPNRRPGRTSRHHLAGAGLWRRHHRHRQSRAAERGCLAGPRRSDAWPLPTISRNPSSLAGSFTAMVSACSAASAYKRAGHRYRRLCRAGAVQRLVAKTLSIRPGRMAVAHADVRRGAADVDFRRRTAAA